MALHMNARGHPLICDDICAVDTSGAIPLVWPGLCNLKLWRDALTSAARAPDGLEQVLPTLDKYRLPVAATAQYEPYALETIFGLAAGQDGTAATIVPLGGAEAATLLIANTFRGQLVVSMERSRAHFDQIMAIARDARIERLTRPWSIDALSASCTAVARAVKVMS
jgi:hypothetical protein